MLKTEEIMKIYILVLFAFLFFVPELSLNAQKEDITTEAGRLKIASCQFPISANVPENAQWIKEQMKTAADSGAEVVHFPECALSGYPGVDHKSLDGFNWTELHTHTRAIMELASELEIWVLLGSIHQLGDGVKPMNSLYVIDPKGNIEDRYDKRFCTGGDLKHFSAGEHFVTFEINEVRCGLLICYDVRFPELYREYRKLNVDVVFQSFYNARQKPGAIHPKIMPITAQTRAATNYFYMSLTNSSAPSSWPCHFITPDGLIQKKLDPDNPGILFSEIDLSERFYDASGKYRENAMDGNLSSGEAPDHSKYLNRKGI
jgi:predicted amidohydrolase